MRTLHVIGAWHPESGGVRTFYNALLETAERRGHRAALVVPGERDGVLAEGPSTRVYSVAGLASPVIDPRYRIVLPHRLLPMRRTWLSRILRAEAPDVVEVADKITLCHLAGLLKRRSGPRPTIIGLSHERLDDALRAHVGETALVRGLARRYVRSIYLRQFDAHIANSEYTAEELRTAATLRGPSASRHWRMQHRIFVQPLGADATIFGPWRRSDDLRRALLSKTGGTSASTLVVFAGRLSAEKGVDRLLPALRMALVRGYDVRVVIAGDGPVRAGLMRDARDHLPGRCLFVGHVARREDLAALVASGDVFLHPNAHEPFGIAPLEALISGVAVVLPRRGGVLSYATDDVAWLAAPDTQGLATGLMAVIDRPDESRRRCARAVAMASAWSWSKAVARYFEAYESVDRRRRAGWAAAAPSPVEPMLGHR